MEQYTGPLALRHMSLSKTLLWRDRVSCPDNKQYVLVILSGHETPSTEFFNTTEIYCSPFLTEQYTHNGHMHILVVINFLSNLVFVMDIRNRKYAFNIKSGVHVYSPCLVVYTV